MPRAWTPWRPRIPPELLLNRVHRGLQGVQALGIRAALRGDPRKPLGLVELLVLHLLRGLLKRALRLRQVALLLRAQPGCAGAHFLNRRVGAHEGLLRAWRAAARS